MRIRTVVDRVVWVAIVGSLVYAAVNGGVSYFETSQLVDQAVFEAGRRPRAAAAVGQPSVSTLQEFAVDTREAILVAARRSNVPVDASKLTVAPDGAGIRVSFHWSYVVLEIAGETVLAVPLWLNRTFELKP